MATSTAATTALDAAGLPYTVHRYEHDPRSTSFGREAAERLEVATEQLFKTLVVRIEGLPGARGGRTAELGCAVVPVAGQLDLKACAAAFGGKRAELADPVLAERATGYVRGGISPLGQRTPLPCVVDETAVLYDTVFVSAGQRGLQVELRPDDLVRLTSARYADISTG